MLCGSNFLFISRFNLHRQFVLQKICLKPVSLFLKWKKSTYTKSISYRVVILNCRQLILKHILLQFEKVPLLSLKTGLKILKKIHNSYSCTVATTLVVQFLVQICLWAVSVQRIFRERAACRAVLSSEPACALGCVRTRRALALLMNTAPTCIVLKNLHFYVFFEQSTYTYTVNLP